MVTRFVLNLLSAAWTAESREEASKSCRKIFKVIFSWSLIKVDITIMVIMRDKKRRSFFFSQNSKHNILENCNMYFCSGTKMNHSSALERDAAHRWCWNIVDSTLANTFQAQEPQLWEVSPPSRQVTLRCHWLKNLLGSSWKHLDDQKHNVDYQSSQSSNHCHHQIIIITIVIIIMIFIHLGSRSSITICASTAASRPANRFLGEISWRRWRWRKKLPILAGIAEPCRYLQTLNCVRAKLLPGSVLSIEDWITVCHV